MIISMNIRSLPKHYQNILHDQHMRASVIALQETWCAVDKDNDHLQLPGYSMHIVSQGRGKGVVTYYKPGFQVSGIINTELYQISKVSSKNFDIVNVYCSHGMNKAQFLRDIGSLLRGVKPTFIVGDFNINFLHDPKDSIIQKITSNGFKQIVEDPTHVEGGLLDHVYIRGVPFEFKPHIQIDFRHYTDHGAITIIKP